MIHIPDDVARQHAARLRRLHSNSLGNAEDRALADLLDPQPPTLREQVATVLREQTSDQTSWTAAADAVLAVVADWLAAQPLAPVPVPMAARQVSIVTQRDHDVRLLRGGSDG